MFHVVCLVFCDSNPELWFVGVISSSVGTILKSCGLKVTAIKIDPYLNIDAGTFSPYEHGKL